MTAAIAATPLNRRSARPSRSCRSGRFTLGAPTRPRSSRLARAPSKTWSPGARRRSRGRSAEAAPRGLWKSWRPGAANGQSPICCPQKIQAMGELAGLVANGFANHNFHCCAIRQLLFRDIFAAEFFNLPNYSRIRISLELEPEFRSHQSLFRNF